MNFRKKGGSDEQGVRVFDRFIELPRRCCIISGAFRGTCWLQKQYGAGFSLAEAIRKNRKAFL
ncbi:MAG: hypothetical protein ACOCXC_05430, partial [Fibrobacterota bacterium]